jgi:histidyl-tRNA synthetase
MKRAAAQNSWAALVVGPDELARGEATLKLMDSGEQKNIQLTLAAETLAKLAP